MLSTEYKIVQIGVEYDYSALVCNNLKNANPSFNYCLSLSQSLKGFTKVLYKMHTSDRFNHAVKLPFKRIWARKVVSKEVGLKEEDNVVFVYQGGVRYFDINAFKFLKKKYPKSVFIYIYNDLVSLNEKNYPGFLEKCRSEFDLICTYNPYDSIKHNLLLKKPMIPSFCLTNKEDNDEECDVFFVGREKGRLQVLLDLYNRCTLNGLKCDFYIFGVPEEKQLFSDSIHYNHFLSYEETIDKAKKAKCILNIVQDGSSGITLRIFECIGLKKMLMTNDASFSKTDFYDPKKVVFIDQNIPYGAIKKYKESEWSIKGDYSPSSYFDWIHSILLNNGLLERFK